MPHNMKVLIVDDDAHIRRILEVKFKKLGFTVFLSKNGIEALTLIENIAPDVLISDISMPIMDGIAFLEKIEPLRKKRNFLTIIITARISTSDQIWAESMNDTKFVEKPFSISGIVKLIEDHFGETRCQR